MRARVYNRSVRTGNRQLKRVCACEPPRIIRGSRVMFERAGILCGHCGELFLEEGECHPAREYSVRHRPDGRCKAYARENGA